MSTTVQYKGNTLTTVSNATKTLKTAGKYMEGDVILTDDSTVKYTATLLNNGIHDDRGSLYSEVRYNNVTYYQANQTFEFIPGQKLYCHIAAYSASSTVSIYTDDELVYSSTHDLGYDLTLPNHNINISFSQIRIDINSPTISIQSNGNYDITDYIKAIVAVPTESTVNNQNKSVTPSESQQSITADSGYTGLGTVTVGAISSTYVGSGITRRSSADLTVSGAQVTTPAGYYSVAASKSVASMTLPTAAASSATSSYTKKATIGRSTSTQYINIAPGYNSAGGYYEISAVANGSATGPTSLSGSSATVTTGTNTITLTKTNITTTPTVSAGYVSSATASTATVTLTASVTTKAAATITPGTANQTIAAGTYLTGTQTIAGDADLVGSNIISTANIFGVQGTVTIQKYYTGASAPSSSLGNNGDIYLQE